MSNVASTMITEEAQITDLFIKEAQKSPVLYSQRMLNINPYYYQEGFLDDPYRFKAACFSRQLGKTHSLAIKASQIINMFPESEVGILAQNERRAFEIYRTVKALQMINPVLSTYLNPRQDKKSEMILDIGSRVTYYASGTDGKSIRGSTLDFLLIDEADFIPDRVYEAALPTISATNGGIMMTTTPNMAYTMFYEIFMDGWNARKKYNGDMPLEDKEKPYKYPIGRKYNFASYHYDYTHGLNVINPNTGMPQIDIKVVNILKQKNFDKYEREYLAWWSADSSSYISMQSIAAATKPNNVWLKKPYTNVMGLDLARLKDYTAMVATQISESQDKAIIYGSHRTNKKDWGHIFAEIIEFAKSHRIQIIYYDTQNVGDAIGYWLHSLSSRFNFHIIPVTFAAVKKAEGYANLKMAINTGRLLIQRKNELLIKELTRLQAERSISGVIKIHAPEGEFDDLADAAMLSSKPLKMPEIGSQTETAIDYHSNFFEELYDKAETRLNMSESIAFSVDNTDEDFQPFKPLYEF